MLLSTVLPRSGSCAQSLLAGLIFLINGPEKLKSGAERDNQCAYHSFQFMCDQLDEVTVKRKASYVRNKSASHYEREQRQ
jgi:hypothetical protein